MLKKHINVNDVFSINNTEKHKNSYFSKCDTMIF